MTTSVPTVIPDEKIRLAIVAVMEQALELTRLTGDWHHLAAALGYVRWYHQEIKIGVNVGKYDPAYLKALDHAIEQVQAIVERHRQT